MYIFLAIGFGAMFLSWMNDSGFWVVGKLSGFTEKETLKSWSVVLTVNSVAGLVLTFICAKLFPVRVREPRRAGNGAPQRSKCNTCVLFLRLRRAIVER
jgi:GntP family gluconate:H+ symporter